MCVHSSDLSHNQDDHVVPMKLYKNTMKAQVIIHLMRNADEDGTFSGKHVKQAMDELGMTKTYSSPYATYSVSLNRCGYTQRVSRGVYKIKWATVKKLMSMKLI